MIRPRREDYVEFEDDNQYERYTDYIHDLEEYCDEIEHGNYKELKDIKILNKEECNKALNSLSPLSAAKLNEFKKGNILTYEKSCEILQQLIDQYFNNTADFKHFKLHSDSYLYQKFKKRDLIDYIHILYHNWRVSDNWCDNLLEANHELSNKTEVLLKANNDKETFEYPEVNREKIYKKLEECSHGWHINNKDLIPWDDVIKVVDKLIDDNNELIARYTEEMAMRKTLEFELFKKTQPLKFEDIEDAFKKNELPNFVIYDKNNEIPLEIKSIDSQNKMLTCFVGGYDGLYDFEFEENRFYLVNIPNVGG